MASRRPAGLLEKKVSHFFPLHGMIPFLQDALWAVPGEKAGLQQPPAAPSSLWPPLAESIEVRSTGEPTEDVLVVSAKKRQKQKQKRLQCPPALVPKKKAGLPLPLAASGSLQQPPVGGWQKSATTQSMQAHHRTRQVHSAEGCDFSGWPFRLPNCQIGLTPQRHDSTLRPLQSP